MAVNTHVQPAGAGTHFATKLDYKAPGKRAGPISTSSRKDFLMRGWKTSLLMGPAQSTLQKGFSLTEKFSRQKTRDDFKTALLAGSQALPVHISPLFTVPQ